MAQLPLFQHSISGLIYHIKLSHHLLDPLDKLSAPHRVFDLVELDEAEGKVLFEHGHAKHFLTLHGVFDLVFHVLRHIFVVKRFTLVIQLLDIAVDAGAFFGHSII